MINREAPAGLAEAEYDALLRVDFAAFAERAFHTLYPSGQFQTNWHVTVIAARLAAVRTGRLRRLLINLPPRHLKSLLASVAFPAWVLGHEPPPRSSASAMPRISPTNGRATVGASC